MFASFIIFFCSLLDKITANEHTLSGKMSGIVWQSSPDNHKIYSWLKGTSEEHLGLDVRRRLVTQNKVFKAGHGTENMYYTNTAALGEQLKCHLW